MSESGHSDGSTRRDHLRGRLHVYGPAMGYQGLAGRRGTLPAAVAWYAARRYAWLTPTCGPALWACRHFGHFAFYAFHAFHAFQRNRGRAALPAIARRARAELRGGLLAAGGDARAFRAG